MTIQMRYVLRKIRSANMEHFEFRLYNGRIGYCDRDGRSQALPLPFEDEELETILDELVTNRYVKHEGRVFRITHKGMHPYQFGWDAIKVFVTKSILVPIGVALTTALITHVVCGW